MSALTDLLRRHTRSAATALLFEDARFSYAEVVAAAAARAQLLGERHLDAPRHVGVLLDNEPESLFWLLAGNLAGAPIVGLNSTRRGAELMADITHTDCRLVVTDEAGRRLLPTGAGVPPTLVIGTPAYDAAIAAHAGAALPADDVPDGRSCVLIFTSGTTSAPKAAIRTHGAMAALAERIAGAWEVTAADVAYNAMPWFHSNALYHAVYPTIATGSTLALRRRFSASGFIDDVRAFGATRFNYVGKVLEYVLATPGRSVDADNRLRIVTGSEASERDIAAFGARFDVYVMDGFGSTEGGVGIMRTPDMPSGALGRAPDEHTVVLDPETGRECARATFDADGRLTNADDAVGELVNKTGLTAFEGYYDNDAANAARSRDGWYWSGDLGYRDAAGFFYFAGRGYDWLRVDGENFSAAPIERIILRQQQVQMTAAYAVPDPNTGDQLMVAMQLGEAATFDADEFATFLEAQSDLGTKWRPRFVRIARHLPTSHTNKIKKAQLRDEAWLVDDPVWWRPDRTAGYRRFTAADAEQLAAAFAQAGRAAVAPVRRPSGGR